MFLKMLRNKTNTDAYLTVAENSALKLDFLAHCTCYDVMFCGQFSIKRPIYQQILHQRHESRKELIIQSCILTSNASCRQNLLLVRLYVSAPEPLTPDHPSTSYVRNTNLPRHMISLLASLALLTTLQHVAIAQLTTIRGTGTAALTGDNVIPTGPQVTYLTYASTITLAAGSSANGTSQVTRLTGGISSKASNATTTTSTKTTSSVAAVNTQPCNNYVEFCSRKYSNITEVAAHNFAFVKKGNLAANQEYGVIDQLNDGVRMRKSTIPSPLLCITTNTHQSKPKPTTQMARSSSATQAAPS